MSYRHLLLAIDLAPNCEPVIQRAAAIAKEHQATLDVVHIIEHSPVTYGGEFSIPIDISLEQAIEVQAKKLLSDLCKKFSISENKQHIIVGTVKHEVLSLAEKLKADLIIVGSHGHHGLDRLLGSRANAILHTAVCDVLAVRVKE